MHVWIIEFKIASKENWFILAGSCKETREQIRKELKWYKKARPYWTLRIVKYTSTKGK